MGNTDTIRDFLVSLGFQVDESGMRKFQSVLTGVTANVLKMGATVEGAALSVVGFTTKIAAGLDKLYWSSQRTGSTVPGMKALTFAAAQTGSSAEAAQGALESLARFVRNSPGAEGFLNRLGVQTRDASGKMRDMSAIFSGVGQKLKPLPYYRANHYAQMLGIDENTLMAMRRGFGQFSAQYTQMAKAIGYNANAAAQQSNLFMTSLRSFGLIAEMARDKIGATLARGLASSIDNLRRQVVNNFPRIEQTITSGANGLMWVANILTRVILRLVDGVGKILEWWDKLDSGTRKLIEVIGGLVVAWRLLNSAFMMSPIGRVIGLATAIALLFEDYQTWREGGQSLIDWAKWKPEIDSAVKGINHLKDSVLALFGIDPKKWTGQWDFANLMTNLGDFGKMLDYIAQMLSAIKDGRWKDAYAAGKELLNQRSSTTKDALPGVTESAINARNWLINSGSSVLNKLQTVFDSLESQSRLPQGLLRGVATTESSGNPNAQSKAGAQGLFQLMPGTASDLGLRGNDVFDPVKAAQAAAKYLSQLMKANGGDLSKTLASYNWGLGNVRKHGMALMPQETRHYIPRVLSNMPGTGGRGIQQETTINVYGTTDPVATGMDIAGRQTSVNARLIGQTKQRAY